ncbi:MAG: hypothetical protein Pars92KO_25970 [Parasphingorhabdus sp.]
MSIGDAKLFALPIGLFLAIVMTPTDAFESSDPPAEKIVELFEGVLPKTLDDGTYLAAPRVEDDVAIFTIKSPHDFEGAFTASEFARLNKNAFCANRKGLKSYFREGGKARIDVSLYGGPIHKGEVITRC